MVDRRFVLGFEEEVDAGKEDHDEESVEVSDEDVFQSLKVVHCKREQTVNVSAASVIREGKSTELRNRERTNKDQRDVEKERVHEGVAHAHGMDGEDEDAHAELEAALDAAEEEVEGEESIANSSEKAESVIEGNDQGVEEGVEGVGCGEHEEDDVQQPQHCQYGT